MENRPCDITKDNGHAADGTDTKLHLASVFL